MVEENPFGDSLFLLQKILVGIERNFDKKVSVKELQNVEEELAALEASIDQFVKDFDQNLLKQGFTESDLKKFKQGVIPENAPADLKKTMDQLKAIEGVATSLKISAAEERGEYVQSKSEERPPKKVSKQEHMKKYKRLGGGPSGWRPM